MASTANVDHMTAQVYKPVECPYYKNHPHLLILSRIRVSNICVSTLDKAIPLSMISVYLFTRNLKKNSFFSDNDENNHVQPRFRRFCVKVMTIRFLRSSSNCDMFVQRARRCHGVFCCCTTCCRLTWNSSVRPLLSFAEFLKICVGYEQIA